MRDYIKRAMRLYKDPEELAVRCYKMGFERGARVGVNTYHNLVKDYEASQPLHRWFHAVCKWRKDKARTDPPSVYVVARPEPPPPEATP